MKDFSKQAYFPLMVLATTILLFGLVVAFAYAYNLITFPFDYDQGEGFELVDTIMFSEFRFPYQNTEAYPFYSSNYPPLYHMMAAPFVWVFGEAHWYGRLLSFIATLIAASAIAYAVYRDGRVGWIAVLSGLAFMSSNTVYHIAPLFRQHIMMVMFEVLAVVILAKAFPQQKTWQIALGLGLLIAAGYTKQLAAITAIAVLAWMVLRNPRRGLLWSVGFAVVGLVIFAWLTVSTDGEWWRQAIVANVNQFDPFQMFGLSVLWWQLHGALIILALLLSLYEVYLARISLYTAWFIIATVLGAIGSGTWGAGDSYFATAIAAMCILSGIFASKILTGDWRLRENFYTKRLQALKPFAPIASAIAVVMIPVLYIGYGLATFKMPTQAGFFQPIANVLNIEPNVMPHHFDSASYDVLGYANIGHFVTRSDREAGFYIVDLIERSEKPVMSEEAGFSIVAGRDVITNPTQLRNLWLAGLWDGSELSQMVSDKAFGLIILRAQFYPVPLLEVIGQHYSVDEVVLMNGFQYLILRPNEIPSVVQS